MLVYIWLFHQQCQYSVNGYAPHVQFSRTMHCGGYGIAFQKGTSFESFPQGNSIACARIDIESYISRMNQYVHSKRK